MRTLSINSFYPPYIKGGAEISTEIIIKGMVSRGHKASVLSLNPTSKWVVEHRDGVEVIRMPTPNLHVPYTHKSTTLIERFIWKFIDQYNPKTRTAIGPILSQVKPDVVFTHNLAGISIAAWQACRQRKIPIIHILHDYYLICPNVNMIDSNTIPCERVCKKCKILRQPHLYLSSRIDAVVGVSESILRRHESAGYFRNLKEKHVIYNARYPVETQARAPKSERSMIFGFIGGLTVVKGIEHLLRACHEIGKERNVKLLIAGTGHPTYVQSLQKSASSASVEFLGYVPSSEFYSRIDVLVVPSLWHEPLGSVIFEALAHGVPVIGSRRGGIPEIVKDGFNGLLYDPSDYINLVVALGRILNDENLLQKLASNAVASVHSFTDPKRMIDEYEALAARLCKTA